MKESLYSVNDDLWNSKNNDNESVCVSEIPPSQKPWKFWPRLYLSSSGTWGADGEASTRGSFQLRRSPAPLLDNPSRWASSIILENFEHSNILKHSCSTPDHPSIINRSIFENFGKFWTFWSFWNTPDPILTILARWTSETFSNAWRWTTSMEVIFIGPESDHCLPLSLTH